MSEKRTASESEETATKRMKVAESATNDILATYSDQASAECQTESQSHGQPTFAANTEGAGEEFDELRMECFDDFDRTNDLDRQPVAGPLGWIQQHIALGTDPRYILQEFLPANVELPENMDIFTIWRLIFEMFTDPQPRQKLTHVNTIGQVVHLLRTCKNIVILTGAGVSVSCGIPDFRSRDGVYARLSKEYPDLPDPQAMFDIKYFRHNCKPFYKFAKEIYPGKFKPSLSHRFIHQVEKSGQLLRNYTQNIDTLEKVTGITQVVECHGSFATASCMNCKHKVTANAIKEDILNQVIPRCPKCPVSEDSLSVMKPDIVFFGESLPQQFHERIEQDINQVDLLIVIGSSLKVRPVALIPNQIPSNVPQILINREPLSHLNFDVELLGDCDTTIAHICKQLGEPWLDVLQGFEIPKVSKEYVSPFLQTPPPSPTQDCCCKPAPQEDNICTNGDQVIESEEKINTCCEPEDNREDADLPYIFLPPCRYIFHGAELTCSQSSSFSKDDSTDSSQTDDSSSDNSDQLEDDEDVNVDPELVWNKHTEETQSPDDLVLEEAHFTDQHNSNTKIHARTLTIDENI